MRSLRALAIGFPLGITAAFLFTLLCEGDRDGQHRFRQRQVRMVQFIVKPDEFSVLVACFAGAAGMLSLTSSKSGALIGVLVSVTTIPAAANIGVAAALANWSDWVGAMAPAQHQPLGDRPSPASTLNLQRASTSGGANATSATRQGPGGPLGERHAQPPRTAPGAQPKRKLERAKDA